MADAPIKVSYTQETHNKGSEFRSWFRGEHTNRLPHNRFMFTESGMDRFVLKGWIPEKPFIDVNTRITAFGSCFARNISVWLANRKYNLMNEASDASSTYVVTCGEGMVNSFVILQQFEWAWENKHFEQELWHGFDKQAYGYDSEIQAETKKMFDETDVFILTFGLSEVWYDKPSGNVFWRTIPKDVYDPERHRFRMSSVQENKDNIREIYRLIRKHRPDAKIIVSLSPIPLAATFRDNSCITSNAVSKAVLRVAIDEVYQDIKHENVLHYWPSYELVADVFRSPFKDDRRHPQDEVLDYIMMLFERTWCSDSNLRDSELLSGFLIAGAVSDVFPAVLKRACKNKNAGKLESLAARDALLKDERADASLKKLLLHMAASWREEKESRRDTNP